MIESDHKSSIISFMNSSYPSIELLAKRAKQRMPGFAYDYLAGGCMAEVNLHKNTSDIRAVELRLPTCAITKVPPSRPPSSAANTPTPSALPPSACKV